ncbi:MAG: PilN domain-containing protein [Candidatus Pacebacteria bacterium]|nr:PilN domain-containing protein [Candidatus Paceibacterota bacterium]
MIKINLLSPDDKISIKWEKINSFVKTNIFLIVFIQILVIICFIATIFYVDIENKSVAKKLEDARLRTEIKELELIRVDAKRYNQESKAFLEIQEGQVYWTRVFNQLGQITPSEVKIESINIESKIITNNIGSSSKNTTKTDLNVFEVRISGISKKKASLKQFEDNLEESSFFSGFGSKPENYVSEVFNYLLFIEKDLLIEN